MNLIVLKAAFDWVYAFQRRFSRTELPVDAVRGELANAIRTNRVCIVVGETGCGKSTQIPQVSAFIQG